MHIVQISDLHLQLNPKIVYGIDLLKKFESLIQALTTEHGHSPIDHLIISGDLCCQYGQREVYIYIKKRIDTLNIPYSVISGNHDDNIMLAEVFGLDMPDGKTLYYSKKIKTKTCLFFDTTDYTLSKSQQTFLELESQKLQEPIFIFMHHPPAYCGIPYIDEKYAFKNIRDVQNLLKKTDKEFYIFAGHYHTERTIFISNKINIFLCPSLFYQISHYSKHFLVESHRIAYRKIMLRDDNNILTCMKYV